MSSLRRSLGWAAIVGMTSVLDFTIREFTLQCFNGGFSDIGPCKTQVAELLQVCKVFEAVISDVRTGKPQHFQVGQCSNVSEVVIGNWVVVEKQLLEPLKAAKRLEPIPSDVVLGNLDCFEP